MPVILPRPLLGSESPEWQSLTPRDKGKGRLVEPGRKPPRRSRQRSTVPRRRARMVSSNQTRIDQLWPSPPRIEASPTSDQRSPRPALSPSPTLRPQNFAVIIPHLASSRTSDSPSLPLRSRSPTPRTQPTLTTFYPIDPSPSRARASQTRTSSVASSSHNPFRRGPYPPQATV
ncbi:hypothetical protein N7523_005513 [Penicillium sp. IBT 18751x]|nr:hypothetical protein N7523_005513 [Penicillium sp. IBT 18751x]